MSTNPSTTREKDDGEHQRPMALSYSSPPVAVEGPRTLPSIRELLPEHVGGSTDPAPYASQYRASAHSSQGGREPRQDFMNPSSYSSVLNERSRPHHSTPPRQPGHERPSSHHGSSSLEPQRMLPPIRDLQARGNDFRSHRPGYDSRQEVDARYTPSQLLHGTPGVSTSMSRSAEQARPYSVSGTSSPYASPPRHPGATEQEYVPRQFVTTVNPQNGALNVDSGESRTRRRRGNLPKAVTDVLRQWIADHLDNPYPSDEDKQMLIAHTGLTSSQLSNWLINARRRTVPVLRQARAAGSGTSARDEAAWSDPEETSSLASDSPAANR